MRNDTSFLLQSMNLELNMDEAANFWIMSSAYSLNFN